MFRHLKLTRPLAVFDLETTGTDPASDRIVEISITKVQPDGTRETKTRRLNPTIPIPPSATAIHKITDADVANEPTFKMIARGLNDVLAGCDLCGFNLTRFDLPLLRNEFKRVGIDFSLDGRAIIDPMTIFHRYEPRDLSAASRFYLNRDHVNAHSAEADVSVTMDILDAMLEKYTDLPRSPAEIAEKLKPEGAVDQDGKFRLRNDKIYITFGKHRGIDLDVVLRNDRSFLEWMLRSDFSEDTKRVVREALAKN